MPDFIYELPSRNLATYSAIAAILAMLIGLLIVKPVLRLVIGTGPDFNNSLSFATSGFSLFYGLLLGLLTVAAYQNSERVRESIMNEATSLGSLYGDINSYPEPTRSEVKTMMRDYVLFTIYRDWPAHRRGDVLNGGFNRADAMRQALARFEPENVGREIIHAQVMGAFQDFNEARQRRLNGVITKIPDVLWYAVLVGALINMLLLVLLRMRLLPQFFLGSISAFFLGVILFVIVTLDQPLRGMTGLGPDPLELLWERSMAWDEPIAGGADG